VLKAIRLLIDQGNRNIRYIVTGDGELRSDLEQQSQSLNLTPHVEFAGRVSEERLANLQAEADIFLHPQINLSGDKDFEGFGLAIAEAMACGIPVVAGNEGAPKEFVQHGVTGFLVDGSPQEIADATSQLFEDRELRQRIGQNAKRWVRDNLSWDKHIRPFLNESFSEN
jgi:phosphatidylinositol alpha-1,6-mannosyltransferase